jgi:PAS domain S-box-containing protein
MFDGVGLGLAICSDLAQVCRELTGGAAALLLIEEALARDQIGDLAAALMRQPPWSELPILVLTRGGAESGAASWLTESLGNVILLERAVHPLTLVSAVRAAVNNRRRQYQLRDYIAEQKRQQEALRFSEERFRTIAENAQAVVGVIQGKRFVYVNPYLSQISGYTTDEILAMDFIHMVRPDYRQLVAENARRRLAGEPIPTHYEFAMLTKSGQGRWIDLSVGPVLHQGHPAIVGIGYDITQRRLAEEALRASEEKFNVAFASNPAAISLTRLSDGLFLDVNDAWSVLTGYSHQEIVGTNTKTTSHWSDLEARARFLQALQKDGSLRGWEQEFRKRSGEPFLAQMSAQVLNIQGEQIILTTLLDITARRRAEDALRISEEKFNAAFASNPAAIGLTRVDGLFLDVNDAWSALFGYSRQEIVGTSALTISFWPTPQDRARFVQALQRDGSLRGWEQEFRKRSGEPFLAQVSAQLLNIQGEQVILTTFIDITQRKRAEEQLRQSNMELAGERFRWQGLVEGMPDEVWTCDPAGKISLLNVGSETTMPLAPFKDKSIYQIMEELQILNPDGQERPPAEAPLLRSLQGDILRGEEIVRHRRTGVTRWRHISSAPLHDPTGRIIGAVAVVRDVTAQKEMEMELDAARLAAEHARAAAEEANRAKDHFLAVLSHELRTPLTAVIPALEDLAGIVPETAREDLKMAQRNVELEARLIDDLLDVTRISRGKVELHRETVEFCTVIRRAAEVCAPDIEARHLHFGINVDAGPYLVHADPARLQQVFWNLIKNAVKFTPDGGCVGIHCFGEGGGHVVATVKDSGIGIEPDALPRIFTAFEQVDRSVTRQFGGLGLGLAISKTLLDLHGGTIQVHSEGRDKGATFTVRLPIARTAPPPAEEGRPPGTARVPVAGRELRILLVEDHGDTARIMSRMLQARGYRVQTAGDVATALELARHEPFDLLLSDLGLPDRSGLELMQELRGLGFTFPAIALSGYGQEEDIYRSREAGFTQHLTKPVNMAHLEQAIRRVTAGVSA